MHLLNASDRSSENASGELPYVSTYYCPFLIQLVQLYIHAMADPAIGVASFYPSEARSSMMESGKDGMVPTHGVQLRRVAKTQ